MALGFPLGLLGLLAAVPLVAAYFLRRRQPPRVVSALFLWRSVERQAEAGAKFERFSRELSLALELLMVLMGALFVSDVRCSDVQHAPHLVIVLDGSLSMMASTQGRSSADRARDVVAATLARSPQAVVTIVESGVKSTVLAGPRVDAKRAAAQLETWEPAQPAHDFNAAWALANELAGSNRQRVLFITDGALPEGMAPPANVEITSVGHAAGNVAFVSAQRRDENGAAVVTVRVGNFTDGAKQIPVRFTAVDGGVESQQLSLEAGKSGVVRVMMKATGPDHCESDRFEPTGSPRAESRGASLDSARDERKPTDQRNCGRVVGDIRAELPSDALGADGVVTLMASTDADVDVALLLGLDAAAHQALKRFIAIAPGIKQSEPALLTFGPRGSQARVTIGAPEPHASFVGPFFAQKGHPLLDDVQLSGVVWTAGTNPPGRPLLSAGSVVLMSEEDDGRVHLNLELSRSNVQRTPAWPIVLMNAVRAARLTKAGLPKTQLMLGEDVAVVTKAGSTWVLSGPRQLTRQVLGVGAVTLSSLPAAGRWALLENGKPVDALEVMALDPRESDVRTRGPFEVKATQGELFEQPQRERPREWWPLAAMLVLLLVDFWLTARLPSGRIPTKVAT